MATAVKNADNTLTVTLSPGELKVLTRWAQDSTRTPGAQFADVINGFLQNKRNDYRQVDGPTMRDKYDAATPAVQAQVDTLLGV